MLQDQGKLRVTDPVAKYLPGFANLKTPSGKPANLTITQILTHTSGLGEASDPAAQQTRTLADLVPLWLAAPMQYEPGEKWQYTQSGINAAARIVEVVKRTELRRVSPETTPRSAGDEEHDVLPTDDQRARLATGYARNKDTGASNRCRRARITAPVTGHRWETADSTRRRPTLCGCAECFSTAGRSTDAVTSPMQR